MCGILGFIPANKAHQVDDVLFLSALNRMSHRGPDGFGVYQDENIRFGHRRLSIIDLSEDARQPFLSGDGKVSITFNGEIYNYQEISSGLPLRTSSDTEVLLEGYIQEGVSFFNKIRGIYAFAIYDQRAKPVCIMMRDPAGIKPFYYINSASGFVFASEIKAILPLLVQQPAINHGCIKKYIHLGYCPEPETAYEGLFALEPGCCISFDMSSGALKKDKLLSYDYSDINIDEQEAVSTTAGLLKRACQRNLVADVKVNIALSGGIDSSLIFAYSNGQSGSKVTGITVAFDEKEYDESEVARAYADHLGAPHQVETIEVSNKLELLDELLLHFDQPYADSSFIPFYFLCQAAAKHSKVLIGGDSGDEIHNGYSGYRYLPYLHRLQNSVFKQPALILLRLACWGLSGEKKRYARKLYGLMKTKNLNDLLFYWESWFPPNAEAYPFNPFKYNLEELSHKQEQEPALDTIERAYFEGRMQGDYLRKSDMMSMFHSLEFRVPMLDEDLTAFSLQIPYLYKSDRKIQKKILRKIHQQIFPSEFSSLKKKGFTIPLDTWLGEENLEQIRQSLLSQGAGIDQYIHPEYIEYLFRAVGGKSFQDYISRAGAYQRILILYSLELWLQKNE